MRSKKIIASAVAVCLSTTSVLSGCATSSQDIATAYVSPVQYQAYDCAQLTSELQRISGRVSQLGGRLDQAASNDKWLTGAGLILFWPALFALGGTKAQEQEYARLKGEYEAASQMAIAKKCDAVAPVARPTAQAPASPSASAQTPTQ